MWDVRPRLLWQKLFDFYRGCGCPLNNMDNILIDYRNCQELFNRIASGETEQFLFQLEPGHLMTSWLNQSSWFNKDDPTSTVNQQGWDFAVLVTVNEEKAKFKILKGLP